MRNHIFVLRMSVLKSENLSFYKQVYFNFFKHSEASNSYIDLSKAAQEPG